MPPNKNGHLPAWLLYARSMDIPGIISLKNVCNAAVVDRIGINFSPALLRTKICGTVLAFKMAISAGKTCLSPQQLQRGQQRGCKQVYSPPLACTPASSPGNLTCFLFYIFYLIYFQYFLQCWAFFEIESHDNRSRHKQGLVYNFATMNHLSPQTTAVSCQLKLRPQRPGKEQTGLHSKPSDIRNGLPQHRPSDPYS